jgi:hypothetical protein
VSGHPLKTGEFDTRLRAAVGRELRVHGIRDDQTPVTGEVLADALFAGLRVLAEEFGPRPEVAAPVVRELPTEPGAVVIVTNCTDTLPPEGWPMYLHAGLWTHAPSGSGFAPAEIYEFIPARVIRDDELGPVQALHRIAHQEFDRKDNPEDVVDELREVAAEALKRLDGETS